MEELTDREQKVLDYIARHIETSGRPPSLRDICDGCGFSSTSMAFNCARRLRELGLISGGPAGSTRAFGIPGARTVLPGTPVTVRTAAGELVTGELVGSEAGA